MEGGRDLPGQGDGGKEAHEEEERRDGRGHVRQDVPPVPPQCPANQSREPAQEQVEGPDVSGPVVVAQPALEGEEPPQDLSQLLRRGGTASGGEKDGKVRRYQGEERHQGDSGKVRRREAQPLGRRGRGPNVARVPEEVDEVERCEGQVQMLHPQQHRVEEGPGQVPRVARGSRGRIRPRSRPRGPPGEAPDREEEDPQQHPVVLEVDVIQEDEAGASRDERGRGERPPFRPPHRPGREPRAPVQDRVRRQHGGPLEQDAGVRRAAAAGADLGVVQQGQAPAVQPPPGEQHPRDAAGGQHPLKVGEQRRVVQGVGGGRGAGGAVAVPVVGREVEGGGQPVPVDVEVGRPVQLGGRGRGEEDLQGGDGEEEQEVCPEGGGPRRCRRRRRCRRHGVLGSAAARQQWTTEMTDLVEILRFSDPERACGKREERGVSHPRTKLLAK